MLNSDDIHKLDSQWSEHPFNDQEKMFYQGLVDTFYHNPICFAGIFTGNDLYNLHETCLLKNYKVDAYDYYPYLNDNDKKVMQDYVIKRHFDKPYVNFCWSDVTKSTKQYSIIYNTAFLPSHIQLTSVSVTAKHSTAQCNIILHLFSSLRHYYIL